ncbi:MAG: hypothetical protein H8E55_45290 [Pelagibacterales bacterium]|nr:hypothetical protein [Pelagibacterales bacterium]|tara:strand:+ start:2349 stop:3389 length:1041 start_codon:yes stop_codon:yes gene_type:complete
MTDQNIDNFLDIVVKKKKIIASIIIASVLTSLVYALAATKLYKTSIYIIPPQQKDINALNIIGKDGRRIATDFEIRTHEVYNIFMVNAQSRKYQRDFFFNNKIFQYFSADDYEESFENFHKNLSFSLQSKVLSRDIREEKFLTVSFLHTDSNEAAMFLNKYIGNVIRKTSSELTTGVNKLVSNKRDSIQGEVDAKINLARRITQDKIVQLKEALKIAKELNITEMAVNASNQQSVILSDENLLNNNPLYLFGTEALEVEIKALSERASEESFVPGLRALQQRVDALNIIKINENDVKAAQIDQEAIPTSNRYSPKRKLIVFLGIIFGIFLSLIYIFFNIIFYRNKT